uniref:IQ motif and ubiquitin-like domain-containing protein n=1 Tax=Arion vulgaris TaxID=1028688 RepID=A0A0B6YSZ7_9EUPU
MTGIGVYVSNMEDKLLCPGDYCTADEYWAMILSNVIILQKNFRRWLAKRYVKQLKEDKEKRLEWERLEEVRKKKEKEERIQREYARRINPKTKADFERLLHCLEKWRKEEMERIDSTLTGAERKAAMCMLLDQETELLSAIERHKNEANYDNRSTRIMSFLEKAAAPKVWQAHDGKLTYMDTPFTIRAKELRDIYNSINMKYLTQDERLDVLLTLKHTVKEHDCKLTQEIMELIDREADLLMRGVKESNLTGLRKRICTLFLQYIKTPTFNPEAAKFLKVPQDSEALRKNINYCHSCGCYLPSTDFFITTNSRNAGRCRRCQRIENEGRQREDHTYYRVMLKALHKSEEAMQDDSTLCYLLQENDLRYLVENIWSNQSVLSAWNDPYDLVLCRWNKHQEWSPWNSILLTHDEAEAHKKLFSLEEGYGHVFIHKVTQKHNFARNYFSRLPSMAEALRKTIESRDAKSAGGASVVGHAAPKVQKV